MYRVGIGQSDFKMLKMQECYFIDKTLFIKDIIDNGSSIALITRPRRFGKTLNMSMLRYYFDCTKKDSKELFERIKNNGTRREIHIKIRSISVYIHDIKRCKRKKL